MVCSTCQMLTVGCNRPALVLHDARAVLRLSHTSLREPARKACTCCLHQVSLLFSGTCFHCRQSPLWRSEQPMGTDWEDWPRPEHLLCREPAPPLLLLHLRKLDTAQCSSPKYVKQGQGSCSGGPALTGSDGQAGASHDDGSHRYTLAVAYSRTHQMQSTGHPRWCCASLHQGCL